MYKEIYVPVDNSDYSNQACVIGVDVARQFGGRVAGCHAYAAKMHDVRFRQMESGLPEEFRDEDEMKRQRKIHDQLITKGLEIITDSYIDVLEPLCEKYDVELVRRSLEGKNFKVIVEDVNENDFDLVVIGAMGMAAVKDTVLGTVTERVVRRLQKADTLIVKDLDRSPFEHIVVAVDGSAKSLGGLKRAIELAGEFGGTVEAISVFDPYFHYAMFHSIAGVLSTKAQKVFRFKEQEKLHEEIIDSGLAKIYTAHLEIARKIAEDEGVDLKTTLLAGKPFEQTLKYVNEVNPTMVVMGRIGYHSDDEMDIGGNTENMMRYLPTNVLITNYEYQAPDLYTAEEHMTWTKEALERLDRIPGFVVGMATGAIIRYAIEKGYTVITTGVIDEVIKSILPPGAMESMRAIGDQMRAAEAMGEDKPIDSLFNAVDAEIATTAEDENLNVSEVYDGRELHWTDDATVLIDSLEEWQEKRRVKARVEKSALKKGYTTITRDYVAQQYHEETGREAPEAKSGGCPVSYAKEQVKETSGATCPIDHSAFQKAGAQVPEGGSKEFTWTEDAIERLNRAPKGFMRNISRNMTEKLARERGTTHIDLALVEDSLSGARDTMEDVITGKVSIADLAKDTGERIETEDGEAPHPPMTVMMVCSTCGEELQGVQPPEECPVCGAPGEDFEQK